MIKQLKRSLAISLLGLAVLPAGSAFAQSDQWNSLYDRIIRLEAEVRGGGGAGAGGGGNVQIQAQLQQLSAQMNAMAQQIYDMQRELNRLRELERQGLLFKKKRQVATAIAPQQKSGQWDQGQVAPAPNYGQFEQSVEIERAPSAGGQIPRGGLASGPQVLGTLNLNNNQGVPAAPAQPTYVPPAQPLQPQAQPLQPQAQPLQPQVQQQWQQTNNQPRQVQGVQSQALPPIGGGQSAGAQQQQLQGQARYQLQQGPQAYQPEPVEQPGFDAQGRPSLAPEKVETALLDGSAGGSNLGAGSSGSGDLAETSADGLFKQAQSSYRSRDFSGAVSGFRSFVTRHRKHELADDAQFLLGEAYYAQGSWKQAAQSYLAGYQNFPDSDKRGSNLLKLGMSLNKLGQKKKACSTFAEVNKKFGKQASLRNSSLKEMQRAGCS
ncbi:MAG: tol-pal system protein YbgF [Anderseniella sp.]